MSYQKAEAAFRKCSSKKRPRHRCFLVKYANLFEHLFYRTPQVAAFKKDLIKKILVYINMMHRKMIELDRSLFCTIWEIEKPLSLSFHWILIDQRIFFVLESSLEISQGHATACVIMFRSPKIDVRRTFKFDNTNRYFIQMWSFFTKRPFSND